MHASQPISHGGEYAFVLPKLVFHDLKAYEKSLFQPWLLFKMAVAMEELDFNKCSTFYQIATKSHLPCHTNLNMGNKVVTANG